jgi:cytochrome c-type biogenesis protein CcmH
VLLVLFATAGAQEVQLEQEVFSIARGLRCMTCDSETAADSNAAVSVEFRRIVREQLQEGRSRDEIYSYFVERYGDVVLMNPPRRGITLIVWLAPLLFGLVALVTLFYYLRDWTRKGEEPIPADPDYLRRVRQEVSQEVSQEISLPASKES